MKKMGAVGMKRLKIFHLISVALWFGGIASLATVIYGSGLTNFDKVNAAYNSMHLIDETVIRNGGQGIFITSLIYSIFTNWGFFKHRWITVKWATFLSQMIFGIVFLNGRVSQNIEILNTQKALALSNQTFINNHRFLQIGLPAQCLIIVIVIWISVVKPWKAKNVTRAAS